MHPLLKSTILIALLASVLAGCATGTSYQRPDVPVPAQWEGTTASTSSNSSVTVAVKSDWWKSFGNAELDGLIGQALTANHDLAIAASRITQARATANVVDTARLPGAELSASATRGRSSQSAAGSSEQSQLGLTVAYEADIWGGRESQSAAAQARLNSSMHNRDAVALVLQADVAFNYFQALALKDRLVIARKNLDAARNILSLVEVRYNKGGTDGLALAQQRTSVLNIEAQIPELEQELRTRHTALAVLLGQNPQGFSVKAASLAGFHIPAVAVYQPVALLERRPDIQRAETQLRAAHADVAAARAALYPQLRLSASAIAGGIMTAGSYVASSLAASLTQSVFDGGRLRSQVDLSQAARDEVVEQYLQSVLVGLKEVQDSLGQVEATLTRQKLLAQAAAQAQEAYRIASVKYQAGAQDLLTLLDSQRTLLQAEDSQVQAELARFTSTIHLFKSLGGEWKSTAS